MTSENQKSGINRRNLLLWSALGGGFLALPSFLVFRQWSRSASLKIYGPFGDDQEFDLKNEKQSFVKLHKVHWKKRNTGYRVNLDYNFIGSVSSNRFVQVSLSAYDRNGRVVASNVTRSGDARATNPRPRPGMKSPMISKTNVAQFFLPEESHDVAYLEFRIREI